jgi:serine/threonine-protein kinase
MIGQTISHYQISAKLGAGGMGEVFLAEDTKLDRQVALKFLPAPMWNDADAKQRLIREAKAASKLDHPNIVTIHGIEESDGRLFIVMAHVNGTNLDTYLNLNVRTTDDLINLVLQVTDGLQRAHEAGVIHRDLKPANILVDDRGRVRLLDFGIARMRGTARMTQVGSTVGTLAYSPPELIQGNDAEPASDIYSLGVVLYQMLTGHLPFEADHEGALLYSILQDDPKPISDHDSAIPGNLQTVVMRCLEKRPENRYANCAALSDALRACRTTQVSDAKGVAAAERPSVAVLPFVNRSASTEDEYFSDGLADELLNLLAKIRGLRVAARASSFHFKGKHEDLAVIGKKLNVATILDGSVRKSGNRVRISVELVKAADGDHLWSETYDRTLEDIFAVQDDIAQSVVKELRSTLLGEEQDSNKSRVLKAEVAQAARGRSTDPEAYRLYLLAQHLKRQVNGEANKKAIEYLVEVLQRDPEFAPAWAALGESYWFEEAFGTAPRAEANKRARESMERALALDPELADGHSLMGWIQYTCDWNWSAAEASFNRALELEPNNNTALFRSGIFLADMGRGQEAVPLLGRAMEIDPLPAGPYVTFARSLHASNRFEEAEQLYRKALELTPQRIHTRALLSFTLVSLGRHEEALSTAMQESDETYRLYALAIVQHALGRTTESDVSLLELVDRFSDDMAFQIAEVYGSRGEVDVAFEWLERAFELRDGGIVQSKLSPFLRTLHADPRWTAFLQKLGLTD